MKKAVILYLMITAVFLACLVGVYLYRLQPSCGDYLSISVILKDQPEIQAKKINLNTATAAQLQNLPGIGPALAERIILYRQENGPFRSVTELKNVRGIGDDVIESILPYVSVGG